MNLQQLYINIHHQILYFDNLLNITKNKKVPPVYSSEINLGETLQTQLYQHINPSYSSTLDNNATISQ